MSPDRSTIHRRDYLGWCTVEMSRGCSNKCDFCISHRFHRSYICRNIDDVIAEVKSLRSKIIFFLDPNLIGDREHAKEFFTEFARLKKWWVGCASLDVVEDPELLSIMAKSGCRGLLMGFESIRREALESSGKIRNLGKTYAQVVDTLHDHGILVQACFVFGFDTDDGSVFEETADYIVNGAIRSAANQHLHALPRNSGLRSIGTGGPDPDAQLVFVQRPECGLSSASHDRQ